MTSIPLSESWVDLFGGLREVALSDPDRVAVTHGERVLTFRELDVWVASTASDLVDALDRCPLPSGSFVPVLVAHDVASVVLLHAGLRAGVPIGLIDAAVPEAELLKRLQTLGESRVALIHDDALAEALPGMTVIRAVARPGMTFDQVTVDLESDATVFFTSGSSGQAKGVVHSLKGCAMGQAALSPQLEAALAQGPIGCIAPFHWAAGFMMALQIAKGQPMVILDLGALSPNELIETMRTTRVSLTVLPASFAVWLAQNNPGPPLADLDHLILGGEPVSHEQISELRGLIDVKTTVGVMWGATEVLSGARYVATRSQQAGPVPFLPFVDGAIRLEESDDDPPPVHGGRVGEIIVRGEIARRYLGQPELTDLRFGVDSDGVRFWRSGDLAEQLPDGTLFLRGRIDDMVKINGKLIEPAESLALLRAFPGIRAVEVLPHRYPSGRIVLVAHVVADSDVAPDAVRRMLMDRLPIHVIPGVLMRHDQLPLTNLGKTDRHALQAMQPVAWLETQSQLPTSKIEEFLLGELCTIIESGNCGVDDDIWFLGLDSLGATELLAAISSVGLGEISPTVLLDHRTVRELALGLSNGIEERSSDVVSFNVDSSSDPLFCIPGAGGTAIGFRPLAECMSPKRPLLVIEAHGLHTRARPDRTIAEMADRVIAFVEQRQPDDIVTLIGHSGGGFVAWEAAQRLKDNGRKVRVVMLDAGFIPRRPRIRLNVWGPAPKGTSFPRKITRGFRSRLFGLRLRLIELRTSRPRADQNRYLAFTFVMARALQRYVPAPPRFPVLFVAAEDRKELDGWEEFADHLTICTVSGDHSTMLKMPNSESVASTITQWIDSCADLGMW